MRWARVGDAVQPTLFFAPKPQLSKNWKAGCSRSSGAGLTSKKSFTSIELERSSTENGMLHSHIEPAGLISTAMKKQ